MTDAPATPSAVAHLSAEEVDKRIAELRAVLLDHAGPTCCWHASQAAYELDTYLWLRGAS